MASTGYVDRRKGRTAFAFGGIVQGGIASSAAFHNAGAPTNGTSGTLANIAGPGAILVDTTNFKLYQNANTLASPTWQGISAVPAAQYAAAINTTNFTATGAQVAGAEDCVLSCTGALGSGQALTLPTAANIVAALPGAYAGYGYRLRIINLSSGNFPWTVTTNTGLTLTGTMTVAQNTYRDFVVTLVSLAAITFQSLGQTIVAA